MSFLFYVFLENLKLCGMDEFYYSVMIMSRWYCFVLSCVFDFLNQCLEGIRRERKVVLIFIGVFQFLSLFYVVSGIFVCHKLVLERVGV